MASRCLARLRSAVSEEVQVAASESRVHLVFRLLRAGAVLWVADPGHLIPCAASFGSQATLAFKFP